MILTYKIRHLFDLASELKKTRKVAEYAVRNKTLSSAGVKHIGLKSVISNQILRKYGRSKTIKKVRSVNLVVPSQGIKVDREKQLITIPSLKISFSYSFPNNFEKINQVELNKEFVFVSVSVKDAEPIKETGWIGVDLNTNGHVVVAANPNTGKVLKLGKSGKHIHDKYKSLRKRYQKADSRKKLKELKHRESNIIKDQNHKMSKKLVGWAKENNHGLKFECLSKIRQRAKSAKSFKYTLNSWSYFQLQQFVEYKAKLAGVPVAYVDPAYTSQTDSKTGLIGTRRGFVFRRVDGSLEHSGVNAAFNIAIREPLNEESDGRTESLRFSKFKAGDRSPFHGDLLRHRFKRERDRLKGSTDTPQGAML